MENDLGLIMCLAPGLVLLILGIGFLRDRILYIKKGHIATATMFKWEERKGDENEMIYTPFFKFTSINNKEIVFEYRSTQSMLTWNIGDELMVAYRVGLEDIYDQLPLTFFDAFGLPFGLLTVSEFLLLISGCIYFDASGKTQTYVLIACMLVFISAFFIWSNIFFKKILKYE